MFKLKDTEERVGRPPVQVSTGCHVEGHALPHPDPTDRDTVISGVCKRFATKPPRAQQELLAEFQKFVDDFLIREFVPIDPTEDTSVESWLAQCNYPLARKELLRKEFEKGMLVYDAVDHTRCKSFPKDETYPLFKHARGINSRHDVFKLAVGPIFKIIEKQVFAKKWFIKKIPVAERPAYIMEMLYRTAEEYFASDYTAYESLFVPELMRVCEFRLYEYMTQHLPQHKEFMDYCTTVLAGENVCTYKDFLVKMNGTRMSGEMNTSLGNGFSNLMFMLFMCHKMGCTEVEGVVEGDDGLFVSQGIPPQQKDFSRLGLNIKAEMHAEISDAGFCGIIFDEEDLINVTDPLEVLVGFGWTTQQYAGASERTLRALMRCKALSYAHQYPGCPIISELAHAALRWTRSYDIRPVLEKARFSGWERDQIYAALKDEKNLVKRDPSPRTRELVASKFGVPIERQLAIEKWLREQPSIAPIPRYFLDDLAPDDWGKYFEEYVFPAHPRSREVMNPHMNFSTASGYRPITDWLREQGKIRP